MRTRINKPALLRKMAEYGQNIEQRIKYLRHNISTLMSIEEFRLFDLWASSYNVYLMMLDENFELIRFNYLDYLIIVQSSQFDFVIEIRKK